MADPEAGSNVVPSYIKSQWPNLLAVCLFVPVVCRYLVVGEWSRGAPVLVLGAVGLLMVLANETFAEISANTWTSGSADRSPQLVRVGGFASLLLALHGSFNVPL